MLEDHPHWRTAIIEMPAQGRDIRQERCVFCVSLTYTGGFDTVQNGERLLAILAPLFLILPTREFLYHSAPLLGACLGECHGNGVTIIYDSIFRFRDREHLNAGTKGRE